MIYADNQCAHIFKQMTHLNPFYSLRESLNNSGKRTKKVHLGAYKKLNLHQTSNHFFKDVAIRCFRIFIFYGVPLNNPIS